MKNLLRLSFLLFMMVAFAACGNDDEDDMPSTPTCSQSDWVGTYSGTQNCSGDLDTLNITITASGSDAVIIEYEDIGGFTSVEYDPLTPNQCVIAYSETDQGITVSLDATLDGDNLTMVESFNGDECTITATRD
ncbi:MAG: hypothetical protein AAGI38_08775 [Bacteroidota bacterium]